MRIRSLKTSELRRLGGLKQLYEVEQKGTREIAEILGCSQPTARKILLENGIRMRTYAENKMPYKKGDKFSAEHKKKISNALIGNRCSVSKETGRHFNYQQVIVHCNWCGREVAKKKCHVAEHNYCDKTCLGLANGARQSSVDNPLRTRQTVACAYCGESVNRIPTELNRNKNTFCSYSCNGKWKAENLVGSKVYNFKGGNSDDRYYGEGWQLQKRKCRERDNNTCQRCYITKEQLGKNMDVHHIKPWRMFGLKNHKRANRLSNLICYCNRCHKIVEEELPRELGLLA